MACIAQMVNVLQSVILTDGAKMIKTPTYYVFKMYKYHQGATLLASDLLNNSTVGEGKNEVPKLFESVSEDENGVITITITNNSLDSEEKVDINLVADGDKYSVAESAVLKGAMNAFNTFDNDSNVKEESFDDYEKTQNGLSIVIPKCSVVMIRIKK